MNQELYDRAAALLERAADEFEALAETEIPCEYPDALVKAYRERHALAQTLKSLPPDTRTALATVYKEALKDAETWTDEAVVKGPAVADVVLDSIETLLEEIRRDRLLEITDELNQ